MLLSCAGGPITTLSTTDSLSWLSPPRTSEGNHGWNFMLKANIVCWTFKSHKHKFCRCKHQRIWTLVRNDFDHVHEWRYKCIYWWHKVNVLQYTKAFSLFSGCWFFSRSFFRGSFLLGCSFSISRSILCSLSWWSSLRLSLGNCLLGSLFLVLNRFNLRH